MIRNVSGFDCGWQEYEHQRSIRIMTTIGAQTDEDLEVLVFPECEGEGVSRAAAFEIARRDEMSA